MHNFNLECVQTDTPLETPSSDTTFLFKYDVTNVFSIITLNRFDGN